MTLNELFNIFMRNKVLLLLSSLVFGLVANHAIDPSGASWEATIEIHIGRVSFPAIGKIEQPAHLVERLNRSKLNFLLGKKIQKEWGGNDKQTEVFSRVTNDAEGFVKISVVGHSESEAKAKIKFVLDDISKEHDLVFNRSKTMNEKFISDLDAEIDELKQEREKLGGLNKKSENSALNSLASILAKRELIDLLSLKMTMLNNANPFTGLYPTTQVGETEIKEHRVSRVLLLMLAVLSGLIFGMWLSLVLNSRAR